MPIYCVVYRINNGSLYSKSFENIVDAWDCYNSYIDIIKYFGGGIKLLEIGLNDFDVVSFANA